MKTCAACGETKPFEAFAIHGATDDRRRGQCRDCVRAVERARLARPDVKARRAAQARARYAANPEQARAAARERQRRASAQAATRDVVPTRPYGDGFRTCSGCGETKPLDAFRKHPRSPDGRGSRCRACVREYDRERNAASPRAEEHRAQAKAWREANPETEREGDRQWREANRERVRELSRESWRRRVEADPEGMRAARREYQRRWREANRERVNARAALWREQNRERAREIGRNSWRRRKASSPGDARSR